MSQYKGQPVTIVRDAKESDTGFDANEKQVVIKNADGTQSTVLRKDVTN